MPTLKVLAYAAPMSLAALFAADATAQTVQPANPITNPDGSFTVAIPPFNPQNGVLARPRPEYDALGLRLGNFEVQPSIGAGGLYNSNVFNTSTNEQSDFAFELTPMLRILSNLPRHALDLVLGARSLFYNRLASENTTDLTFDARGRIDISHSTNVTINADYALLHEARGAPDLPGNAAAPTAYGATTVQAAVNQTFNRLQVEAGASYQRLDYHDTKLIPPGPATLDNRDRNRDIVSGYGQIGYRFSPGYSAFTRGTYNDRNYDLTFDAAGVRRDSHGFEVDSGVQFELSRLIVGQIYAGYLEQNFADPSFSNVGGAAFGAQLEWYPTGLTTVHFDARHSVEETTILGASSYTTSHFGLGLDHELYRNLIFSFDGLFDYNSYNGTPRTDKFWGFSAGMMYLMNRNLQLNLGYVFSRRDSNLPGASFTNNTVRAGVVGKL